MQAASDVTYVSSDPYPVWARPKVRVHVAISCRLATGSQCGGYATRLGVRPSIGASIPVLLLGSVHGAWYACDFRMIDAVTKWGICYAIGRSSLPLVPLSLYPVWALTHGTSECTIGLDTMWGICYTIGCSSRP